MVFFSLLSYTTIFDAITYISRKGAFWPRRLTERRSLTVREIAECAFP